MQFLGQLFRPHSKATRVVGGSRPARSRRAQFTLETLEGRDLKSVAGITNYYGMISIQGTLPSGNQVSVSIDSEHNNDLKITLNGESVWYNPSDVWVIGYNGSQGGSDTFVNDTTITSSFYGFGGNNQYYGGSGYDSVRVYGDFNTIDTREGAGSIEAYNGPNNNIAYHSDVYVYSMTYSDDWFWW